MLVGFCIVDEPGVAPVNDQDQLVGLLVLKSVKLMQSPTQMLVDEAVKFATGTGHEITFTVILAQIVLLQSPSALT